MAISKIDGFYQNPESPSGTSVGIESSRLKECISFIKRNNIKAIFGSPTFGFNETNLDFLFELPNVESVWFWDVNLKNIDALYSLEELKHFGVSPKRPPIDFSRLKKLKTAVVEPKEKDSGLNCLAELELLHVWHFKPKDNSFSSLGIPTCINELQINWASPDSLLSLPAIENLQRLEVHRCKNLKILGDLKTKYPNLAHLVITTCGKVVRSEAEQAIKGLHKLKHAYIQNAKLV